MKVSKKIVMLMVIIFVIADIMLIKNVYAKESANTESTQESSNDSDVVLAYYDIKTQKETLYTVGDLERIIANAKKRRSIKETVEPKSPTKLPSTKYLTEAEVKKFEEANKNTNEYYGETTYGVRAVDNRMLVDNVDTDPYYKIAKLYYTKKINAEGTKSCKYDGTGFAVGYNLCATARHCITDEYGNWVTDFKAYYGYNGLNNSYCDLLTNVSGYVYYPQYITGTNAEGKITVDSNYDIAFVIWGEQTVSETGCFGMSSDISNWMSLRTAGYPGDLDSGYRMYQAFGNVTSYTDTRLKCDNIYCNRGQSGSPYYDTNGYVYGVVTHGQINSDETVSGESSGRRIDAALIQWLQSNGYA